MTAWDEALSALGRELAPRDVATSVERVEARSDGSLIWTVGGAQPRWLRSRSGSLDELFPENDELLPATGLALRPGLISYRPGRRVAWIDERGDRVWKATRSGRDRVPVANLRLAASALHPDGVLRIPTLLEERPEISAFALRRVTGSPPRLRARDPRCWGLIGRGLAEFQSCVPIDGLNEHTAIDELALLVELRTRYERSAGPAPAGFDAALHAVQAAAEGVEPAEPVATHRDLHDGQLLLHNERCWLLDLDLVCAGDPALDPGNLCAHLVLRGLQGLDGADADGLNASARSLLEGLRPRGSERFRGALRFYQASTLARLALLYALRPRWRDLVPVLLENAHAAAAEVILG